MIDQRTGNQSIWRRSVAAGVVGAMTVAVWFLIVDLATGRPFFTPATLGSAIFLGVQDLLTIVAESLVGAITWWGIAGGNFLAAFAMGYYIWRRDPALRQAVRREPVGRTH